MFSSARRPATSRARWHDTGLGIVLVLALLGAPAVGALHNECNLCPPNCPMHQHHTGSQHDATPHLGCHGGGAWAPRFGPRSASTHGPSIACATCGNHGIIPGTVLPPMLLPSPQPAFTDAAAGTARFADAALSSRVGDAPDTPPPIGAA